MSVQFSNRALIIIYGILTCIYLFGSIKQVIDNSTGNRTIGAILMFVYFATILLGLLKKSYISTTISLLNFGIASLFIMIIILIKLPIFSFELLGLLLFGFLGSYMSFNSMKAGMVKVLNNNQNS